MAPTGECTSLRWLGLAPMIGRGLVEVAKGQRPARLRSADPERKV
ncbi:hypothetical protein BH20ACT6_BH20ACT6_12800 [soil metagenome]